MTISNRVSRRLLQTMIAAILTGCTMQAAPEAARPSATASATPIPVAVSPTATPGPWTFPDTSSIAGVDVSGRTPDAAHELVAAELDSWQQAIPLRTEVVDAPAEAPSIEPQKVGVEPDARALVAEAEAQARDGKPVNLHWTPQIDAAKLRAELEAVAPAFEQAAVADVVTDTEAMTTTFTFRANPGLKLNVDATAELLTSLLTDRSLPVTDTVVLDVTQPPLGGMDDLQRVLQEHLKYWKGVGAIYVHDLETGETLGINENTVFSGASVMKVPIMIYVYSKLGQLNEQQREWMENVVINSDNLDANALLAAAVGGQGTEAALEGVNEMTEMLKGLGLKHTYQLIPYESGEWLIQQSRLPAGGPKREGSPPYTSADPYLRTTPREMGELFVMLAQCAEGQGPLIEKYGETINERLCNEMINWLEQPHDQERMVAGIPAGVKVAHKGGWIDDMQSDVGIVSSPNRRYVAAIYIWRAEGYATNAYATPSPYLGDFSHTIYTFFNPEPIE